VNKRKMPRTASIQVGAVALVNQGADAGKLVAIVDIVDQSRALIQGPTSGVARQTIPHTWLSLTGVTFKCPRGAKTGALSRAMAKGDVVNKFAATSWGKKAARDAKRANLNDFQRFQVMVLRQKRSRAIAKELKAIKTSKA